jgi:mannosyltransferase OCH1-like enzyme
MKSNWPSFDASMSNSFYYNAERKQESDWKLLEEKYNKIRVRPQQKEVIPKTIHQIWLGGVMPTKQEQQCISVRKSLPDNWDYILWTDDTVHNLPSFKNYDQFLKTPNFGQKSDLLRLDILYNFGGVYCDTDFIINRPFTELLDLDFFCGIAYDREPNVLNSIMGCSVKSPIIEDMLNLDREVTYGDAMEVIDTTGPYLTTRKLFKNIPQTNSQKM